MVNNKTKCLLYPFIIVAKRKFKFSVICIKETYKFTVTLCSNWKQHHLTTCTLAKRSNGK